MGWGLRQGAWTPPSHPRSPMHPPHPQPSHPIPSLHPNVAAACGRRGEPPLFTRLSGRASAGMLLDRGADLSSPGFMHPQTRNQRCKAQTFCYLSPSSVQSAAAESNLVSAMPRFMVSQPHLRCWLPLGSRKPGLSHWSRMRGPWCVVTLDPRSDPQAGKWPQSLSSPRVGQHLPCSILSGGDRRTNVPGS